MVTFLDVLSVTAITSTFALFLCGVPICHRIWRVGTADTTPSAPFLITLISCSFWLQYGFLKHDQVVIFINIIGVALQACYVSFYYCFSSRKLKSFVRRVVLIELASILVMEYCVQWGDLADSGESALGAVCVILNVITMGSPLLTAHQVIRTKSTSTLPFPLCVANFGVTAQWLAYALVVGDVVILIPNTISILLCTLQLSLFLVYPSTGHRPLSPIYSSSESSAKMTTSDGTLSI